MIRYARRIARVLISMTVLISTNVQASTPESKFLSNVHHFVLKNGLTVIVKPTQKAETVAIHLAVKSGSADEWDHMGSGLSHFVEHMFFKGTDRRPPGEIEKEVRRMGGSTNAYTSYDVTVYYIKALSAYFENAVDLMGDAAFSANFPEDEIEKEREVIFGEFRMNEDRIDRQANIALWKLAFQEHPYGYPVIGYSDLFAQITREALIQYYKVNYVPNNMVMSVVGDVDVNNAERVIRQYFEKVPRKAMALVDRPEEPPQLTLRQRVMSKEAEHARVIWGFPGVAYSHPDSYALDVLAAILGGSKSSRLVQAIKEKEGVAIEIGAFNSTIKDDGLFSIRAKILTKDIETVRESIRREIALLKLEGVTSEELDRVKKSVLADFYQGIQTNSALSHDMIINEIYAGDYRFSEIYVDRIQRIAAEDVRRVATAYLDSNAYCEVVLTPAKDTEPNSPPTPRRIKPVIDKEVLSSGLRLLTLYDDTTPDVVIQFSVLGGTRYETEANNGVSLLAADMLTRGTRHRTREEIANQVESWGGSLGTYSTSNSYGVQMYVLREHLDDAIRLVWELLSEASFPEDEIVKSKELQRQSILAKEENIYDTAWDTLRQTLYQQHPYRFDSRGTLHSLQSLGKPDLVGYLGQTLTPANSVLSVLGDAKKEDVLRIVNKYFGGFKASHKSTWPAFEVRPIQSVVEVTKTTPRKQAVVMMAFNGLRLDDDRKYAFEVLNAITGDSAGRLYQNIRGKHGLSYVVSSDLTLTPDPGYFVFYAAVDPPQTSETFELMIKEAETLRQEGVTDSEIRDAKMKLIGDYQRRFETKNALMGSFTAYELYGLGTDAYLEYKNRIEAVTRVQIEEIIRTFIDPSKSARLTIRPDMPTLDKDAS